MTRWVSLIDGVGKPKVLETSRSSKIHAHLSVLITVFVYVFDKIDNLCGVFHIL